MYFSVGNLNELFSIMLEKHGVVEVPEDDDESL